MAIDLSRTTRRTLLHSAAVSGVSLALGGMSVGPIQAEPRRLGARKLPRARPEEVGIAPESILAFVDAVEQKVGGLHSFMLLRHGKVAAEAWWAPYAPPHPHMLFSLSKSFASTALGLAVSDGLLTVDSRVSSFFPDLAPAKLSENQAAMRVRHLLSMSTGHDVDATGRTTAAADGNWVRAFLALPVEHAPGSKFVYNSAATYMLSAIVQKLTGKTALAYLGPRLLSPLGIVGAAWESCPKGINKGGWGLSVKTEDIARFGQLYLQNGTWEGRQLVPESWVSEATSKQVSNGDPTTASDWAQGYGYQFWRCRHGLYRGDGAFGQYCVVMPHQDAVLAITSGVADMQAVLNLAWEHLLPGISEVSAARGGSGDLKKRLGTLSISHPPGSPDAPTAARVSRRTYKMEANTEKIDAVTVTFRGRETVLTMRVGGADRIIRCGSGSWVKGSDTMDGLQGPQPVKVAASGAWTSDDVYTIKLCMYETPFISTMTCRFAGDQLMLSRKMNVGFGPIDKPTVVGRMS